MAASASKGLARLPRSLCRGELVKLTTEGGGGGSTSVLSTALCRTDAY